MYPAEYFCPKDHTTGEIHITDKTVCIHHFAGSWLRKSWKRDIKHFLKIKLVKLLGGTTASKITDVLTGRKFFKNKNY